MRFLIVCVVLLLIAVTARAQSPAALLEAQLAPPPAKHHAAAAPAPAPAAEAPHSLIQSTATASTEATSQADAQLNMELEAANMAHLSAEERALLLKNIVVPKLPPDVKLGMPVEFMTPQLTDGDIHLPTKIQDNFQNAVNAIVSKAKLNLRQLRDQHSWVDKVNHLMEELSDKRANMRAHITKQMKKLKELLHTKKRIENKQTQEKIKTRLRKTWKSLKKIRTQESWVKKQRLKFLMQKENVEQAIEHIMGSLADLTNVDRDPKIITKVAQVMYDNENYDPDVTDEKTNTEVNDLTKPDRMF